ncbi:hypothetical protein GCM10010282_37950 [Streptomyces roseolus]|nr:hypothetical protein GCM10010282_37950 [Streptomyces roseolus]
MTTIRRCTTQAPARETGPPSSVKSPARTGRTTSRGGWTGEQTLTAPLGDLDGTALFREQETRAEAEDERRRAALREAQRRVCRWCGRKSSDEHWEEITVHRTAVRAEDRTACGLCRADDVARAEAARLEAAASPEPQEGPEPERGRGWSRRRT